MTEDADEGDATPTAAAGVAAASPIEAETDRVVDVGLARAAAVFDAIIEIADE